MPFKSEKQRRFMWAKHPEIAKRWAKEEKKSEKKYKDGGICREDGGIVKFKKLKELFKKK